VAMIAHERVVYIKTGEYRAGLHSRGSVTTTVSSVAREYNSPSNVLADNRVHRSVK
jgi:hypothetical protein